LKNNRSEICILINSIREFDYYDLESFYKNNINIKIVVNDLVNQVNYQEIKAKIDILKSNKNYYFLSSEIKKNKKYKYVLSTGLGHIKVFSILEFIIYVYSRTIGLIIEKINLDKFFLNLIGKSLTAGARNRELYKSVQIEKKFGTKTILFPRGLDINIHLYPETRWIDCFDIFCCHSKVDEKILNNKIENKRDIIKIGYPRYQKKLENKYQIYFKDKNKKNILWIPTHIKYPNHSIGDNIYLWKNYIKVLLKDYNIVVKPHPKTISAINSITETLENEGFTVLKDSNCDLASLYNVCNYVLADYGGSVFSAIYMKKKLILLNLPSNHNYFLHNKNNNLDQIERINLTNIDLKEAQNLEYYIRVKKDDTNKNYNRYFDKNYSINNLINFLINDKISK
tara:strand:- start:223 stop:1413 length:1191 start_codon:yes stop_codon:yes gene_type:complete